jgi:hypothetical protein
MHSSTLCKMGRGCTYKVSRNRWKMCTRLHGVTSHKKMVFILTVAAKYRIKDAYLMLRILLTIRPSFKSFLSRCTLIYSEFCSYWKSLILEACTLTHLLLVVLISQLLSPYSHFNLMTLTPSLCKGHALP